MKSKCKLCGTQTKESNSICSICALCENGVTLLYEDLTDLLKEDKQFDYPKFVAEGLKQ